MRPSRKAGGRRRWHEATDVPEHLWSNQRRKERLRHEQDHRLHATAPTHNGGRDDPELRSPQRHKGVLDALVFTFGTVWSSFFGMVGSLVTRGLVPVQAFGANNIVDVVAGYLGVYNGLARKAISREVPAHLARKEDDEARAVIEASYTTLVLSILLQSAGLLVVGVIVSDPLVRMALWTGAFLLVVNTLSSTDRLLLATLQRFKATTMAHLTTGLVTPAILIALSWTFGAVGFFLGLALGGAIRLVAFRVALGQGPLAYLTWRLNKRAVRQIFITGISITLLYFAQQALFTVDRWVIVGYLDTLSLGYYSLGTAIVVALGVIPSALAGSFFPRQIGLTVTGQWQDLRLSTHKAQISICLLLALVFGGLAIAVDPLIRIFLPAYQPALPALQIIFFHGYFGAMMIVALLTHIAFAKVLAPLLIYLGCAGLAALLDVTLMRYGLVGVAAGTGAAMGIASFWVNGSADRLLGGRSLVRDALVGLGLLSGLYALLFGLGPFHALAYLSLAAMGSAVYLTRLLQLDWRRLPAHAMMYVRAR